MKKIVKPCIRILVVLLAVIVFYCAYSRWLDSRIEELYTHRMQAVNHAMGVAVKDKGSVLIDRCISNNCLLVMGSSELGSPVPEKIQALFPNNLYQGDACVVGHAHVQNSLHAMNLGANTELLHDCDIVVIESLQWFQGSDIGKDGFFSNFSEMQFYDFLQNNRISEENKLYLCRRYILLEEMNKTDLYSQIQELSDGRPYHLFFSKLEALRYPLVGGELTYPQSYILAKLYASENAGGKLLYGLMSPYFWMRNKVLHLKDRYNAYKWLKTLPESAESTPLVLDWDTLFSTAEMEGTAACTNNNLFVYDDYYNNYLAEKIEALADRDSNTPMMDSGEWDDYRFMLSVCRDLNLHPYFVMMSTNGLYYDYIGIGQEKRSALYDRVETMAGEYGMTYLDLRDNEYEPYFYCDVMHLGWKGWPYVVKNILEHYSE